MTNYSLKIVHFKWAFFVIFTWHLQKNYINMSEDLFFKEIDGGKYICLPKFTKTIVKLYFTHNKKHSETFVINYAENFSKKYLEDYEEYQNALNRKP